MDDMIPLSTNTHVPPRPVDSQPEPGDLRCPPSPPSEKGPRGEESLQRIPGGPSVAPDPAAPSNSDENPLPMDSQPAQRRLSKVELLALWQRARRLAFHRCTRTLWRLHRGEGGFYQADDFMQDLFLEFTALVGEWRAHPDASERGLWDAWHRLLSRGGIRVLRRRPQRLWRRAHSTGGLPSTSQGRHDQRDLARFRAPLTSSNPEPYTQPEDSETTREQIARLDDLEDALWALRPLHRQVIYMVTMADLPAAQVARLLGIDTPNAVYARLRTARTALRRRLRQLAHQRTPRDPPGP